MIKSFLSSLFSKKQIKEDIKKEVPNIQTPIKGKRILIVSDIHFPLSTKEMELIKEKYDQCLLLGDVPQDVLKMLSHSIKCPVCGVFGNHDTHESYSGLNFKNINALTVDCGYTIAGMEGSSKYKEKTPYVMMSQEDSIILSDITSKADILISHDSPYQIHSKAMNKEGFKGITKYINEKKPQLHLYGHHHIFKHYMIDDTLCICNYRLGIIERDGKYYPLSD